MQEIKKYNNTLTPGIRWTSQSIYVDIDTGELINDKAVNKKEYIKIKTKRHATINEQKTAGTIRYTIECRKNPQTKLFAS